MSKKDSNVSIHKKLLSQIVEYEHAHVKVSFFHIFIQRYIYMKLFVMFGSDILLCNSFYELFVVRFLITLNFIVSVLHRALRMALVD